MINRTVYTISFTSFTRQKYTIRRLFRFMENYCRRLFFFYKIDTIHFLLRNYNMIYCTETSNVTQVNLDIQLYPNTLCTPTYRYKLSCVYIV